jgi:hypothetical protein
MTREEFYKSERGEKAYYDHWEKTTEWMLLPLTYEGFEAFVHKLANHWELPVDDRLRSLVAGYIHHIPADEHTVNFQKISQAVYKSFSNSMTYEIDQQAKKRALDEAKAKLTEDEKKELESQDKPNNVVPII